MSRRKQGFIVDRRIRCGGTSQRNEENRDHVKKKIKCVAVSGRLAGCRGIISCEREITMTKPKLAALKRAALSSTACTSETQVSSFMRARARAHTTTLLYGDRPPNCRWRPLQICPLDRPVCLPLTLSFTLSLSSFSLSLSLSLSFSLTLLNRAFEPRIATLLPRIQSTYYRSVTNNLRREYLVSRRRKK